MRILIALEYRQPKGYYAPSNIVSTLARSIEPCDEVSILVRTFPISSSANNSSHIIHYLTRVIRSLRNAKIILLDSRSCDVVNFHYFQGFNYIVCSLLPGLTTPTAVQLYFPSRKLWLKILDKYVKLFIVMNRQMGHHLTDSGISKNKIRLIPPPIDVHYYKPLDKNELSQRYGVPPGKFVVLYHGRPATVRGLMLLLNSIAPLKTTIKDLFVVLSLADVNDEDMSVDTIQEYIGKHDLGNVVRTIIGNNNSAEMYNLADVVVFPFLKKRAAICPPLSVLEAMSCGKVVACSDIKALGSRYILRDKHDGFLFEPTEPGLKKIVNEINDLSIETRNAVGLNARYKMQREYSTDVVRAAFIRELDSIC